MEPTDPLAETARQVTAMGIAIAEIHALLAGIAPARDYVGNPERPADHRPYFGWVASQEATYRILRRQARDRIRRGGFPDMWGEWLQRSLRGWWAIRCLYAAGHLRKTAGLIGWVNVARHERALVALWG